MAARQSILTSPLSKEEKAWEWLLLGLFQK